MKNFTTISTTLSEATNVTTATTCITSLSSGTVTSSLYTSTNASTVTINPVSWCIEYSQNNTGLFLNDYDGIPENLIINLICWLALLFLFSFLRRIGNYGRFGLLKNDEERITLEPSISRYNFFKSRFTIFGKQEMMNGANSVSINRPTKTIKSRLFRSRTADQVAPSVASSSNSSFNSEAKMTTRGAARMRTLSNISQDYPHADKFNDDHWWSWLVHLYRLKDIQIKDKSGADALNYIRFQRVLIGFMIFVSITSTTILLPINYSGKAGRKETDAASNNKIFVLSTISNVNANSYILWVHLVITWIFLAVGFILIEIFYRKLECTEKDYVSRTIFITNCKTNEKDDILDHFKEAYPELAVSDVQFTYDIDKISNLNERKFAMHIGKLASIRNFQHTHQRPTLHPFQMGNLVESLLCCLSKHLPRSDAIDFYNAKEVETREALLKRRESVKPLGMCFITFDSNSMVKQFRRFYYLRFLCPLVALFRINTKRDCLTPYIPRESSLSGKIMATSWNVRDAPNPANIKWGNLSNRIVFWWVRWCSINALLIVLLFFLTTPSILLEKITSGTLILNSEYTTFNVTQSSSSLVSDVLPSLLLRILAAILPLVVAYTASFEMHWTRSALNLSVMIKTFIMLLFMVLILPTLGLTSINDVFRWLDNRFISLKWVCISDNGAFFVKYVTTCAFIGTALELLRLPDLLLYLARKYWSYSPAERLAIRIKAAFEYDYGVHYTWTLTIFTVTICFSTVCPLITPFGLIYLILKHLVDRYNIFFAYTFTKVDKKIHLMAAIFTAISLILMQYFILFFIAVRNKTQNKGMFGLQIFAILFSSLLLIVRLSLSSFYKCFKFIKFKLRNCNCKKKKKQSIASNKPSVVDPNDINLTAQYEVALRSASEMAVSSSESSTSQHDTDVPVSLQTDNETTSKQRNKDHDVEANHNEPGVKNRTRSLFNDLSHFGHIHYHNHKTHHKRQMSNFNDSNMHSDSIFLPELLRSSFTSLEDAEALMPHVSELNMAELHRIYNLALNNGQVITTSEASHSSERSKSLDTVSEGIEDEDRTEEQEEHHSTPFSRSLNVSGVDQRQFSYRSPSLSISTQHSHKSKEQRQVDDDVDASTYDLQSTPQQRRASSIFGSAVKTKHRIKVHFVSEEDLQQQPIVNREEERSSLEIDEAVHVLQAHDDESQI